MSEEVVINVKQESQGNALSEAAARIEQLKKRIAELNSLEANYASKGITGTTDLSKERTALQRELGTLEKGQREEKKAADSVSKNEARERLRTEKEITQEARTRDAIMSARMRAAGIAGSAAVTIGGVMAQDYFAHQGIEIGDRAARAGNERTLGLHAARGYSAGAAVRDVEGTEDRIFEGQNGRDRLENERKQKMVIGGIGGIGAGAAAGAALGSIVPGIGTAIGAAIGASIGAAGGTLGGHLLGKQAIAGNEKELQRDTELLAKQQEEKRKYVEGELRPQLEAKKAELAYDMQGKRFAEDKVTAFKTYQSLVGALGEVGAADAATDAVRLQQRERAGNVAGLVNARTGTRGTAQLARIAAGLDDPERAGRVFAAALKPVINEAAQPPLHDWMKTGGRR